MRTSAHIALAAALRRDASIQEAGNPRGIGAGLEAAELEAYRAGTDGDPALAIAVLFWDGWIDSRNHEWLYYEPIGQHDWPVLARHLADVLDGKPGALDPRILDRFTLSEPLGFWPRVRAWLRG